MRRHPPPHSRDHPDLQKRDKARGSIDDEAEVLRVVAACDVWGEEVVEPEDAWDASQRRGGLSIILILVMMILMMETGGVVGRIEFR